MLEHLLASERESSPYKGTYTDDWIGPQISWQTPQYGQQWQQHDPVTPGS